MKMKKNLINTMKAATLGVALLGMGASQVRADEIMLQNQGSNIIQIKYGEDQLGFSLNGEYFDCKKLDNYELKQRVEIEKVCQGLPYLVQVDKQKKIDEELVTKENQNMIRKSLGFNNKPSKKAWDNVGKF